AQGSCSPGPFGKRHAQPLRRDAASTGGQIAKIKFRGRWAGGVDPLNDPGPASALFIMLQGAAGRVYHRPSVLDVDTQHWIKELPRQHRIDILLDVHDRGVLAVTGQTAGSHHSPESFRLYQQASLIGQGVSDTVVLMSGMDHDVRTVQRWPFGI